jgi:hypothetical protein
VIKKKLVVDNLASGLLWTEIHQNHCKRTTPALETTHHFVANSKIEQETIALCFILWLMVHII